MGQIMGGTKLFFCMPALVPRAGLQGALVHCCGAWWSLCSAGKAVWEIWEIWFPCKGSGELPTTVRMPLKGELLEEQARLLSAMKAETFVRAHFLQEWGKPKYSLSSAVRLFLSHSMHREIPAHPLPVSLLVL